MPPWLHADVVRTANFMNKEREESKEIFDEVITLQSQIANNHKTLGCQHNFCKLCIDEWLEAHCTCPLCDYNVNGQIVINDCPTVIDGGYIDYIGPTGPTGPNYNNADYNFPQKFIVYAHTYNILRIMSGTGGLAYRN